MKIQEFFDPVTNTLSFVVFDEGTKDGVVIDPVWDFDLADGKLTALHLEKVLRFVKDQSLRIHFILETHPHADHVSGAQWLKERLAGAKVAVGEKITVVQETFKSLLNLSADFPTDGSQFDVLLKSGASYTAGPLQFDVLSTPGHTPACCCFLIEDHLFSGDVLFMPDNGTGRCDFPLGSAKELYHSVQRLYELPATTKVYPAHDYPKDREFQFQTTIGEQMASNIHIPAGRSLDDFVKFRTERDRQLSAPRLMIPSVQININAGRLPAAEANGVRYLKLPVVEA